MTLSSIKDPDGWSNILYEIIPFDPEDDDAEDRNDAKRDAMSDRFFEYGEYANLEIEFDADLNIVGGRVVPQR